MDKISPDAFVFAFRVQDIQRTAIKIHEDVNQLYDIHPYSKHLNMVAHICEEHLHLFPEQDHIAIMFAAFFHDTIEDARLTYNDVMRYAKSFGMNDDQAKIATEIVYAVTNEKGRTRAERANDKYYNGIHNTKYATFIKFADRLANMRYAFSVNSSMKKKYIQEWEHFKWVLTARQLILDDILPQAIIDDIDTLVTCNKL